MSNRDNLDMGMADNNIAIPGMDEKDLTEFSQEIKGLESMGTIDITDSQDFMDTVKEDVIINDPITPIIEEATNEILIETHPEPIVEVNETIVIEEDIIIPDNSNRATSSSDWKKESSKISIPSPKPSEKLDLEDFELVIKKDNINLSDRNSEDVKFETINTPNNSNMEIIDFIDTDEEGNSLLGNIASDNNFAPHVAKLLEESKVRELKGIHERESNDNYYNAATYKKEDGSKVKLHPGFVNTLNKGGSASSNFLNNINKATNTDVVLSVPLYNSGIWLGIRSPSEPEIIQLQMLALENEIKLGASTAGLVYSNYNVLFTKYALDLAFSNLAYSSVKVENFTVLRELIKSIDENAIINAICATMYPTGVDRMITCSNFLREKNPCNHTVQAKLHFDRISHTDYSRLSSEGDVLLLHMAKKYPDSTTIIEVEEYQKHLSKYQESIKTYKLQDGTEVSINYRIPNIKDHISQGEYWTEKVTMLVNNIITGSNKNVANITDDMMKIYIDGAMRTNLLGLYLHFIKSMTINGIEETDYRIINSALPSLTKIDNVANSMISDITNLIKNSSVTIIGQTQYVCPACKKLNDNETVVESHPFKKIIPFNVLGVLFILGSLKYSTVLMRQE